MGKETSKVISCNAKDCGYNNGCLCRALSVNIGGSGAVCDSYAGLNAGRAVKAAESFIGACKAGGCRNNDGFACSAPGVIIGMNGSKPKCYTFVAW